MPRRSTSLISCALALGLATAAVCPAGASGQTVMLRVVSSETSEPIFGALAHLIDESGQVVRTVLTDERGRALFVRVPAARYRARAEMIGMATQDTEAFDVTATAGEPRELRLDPRPIDVEGIDVNAERRRCTARPTDEGMLLTRLWDEARKALSAAALTNRRDMYRYETMTYERDLDRDGVVVLRHEESSREGYMRVPFASPPPEVLIAEGFVRDEGRDRIYHAPDAGILLSDVFLDTHCFGIEDDAGPADAVGLSFEPMGDRRSVTDIGGTLWLDRQTAELRWLDYDYWNLSAEIGSAPAGGHVEFRRMPDGTWIVPEWWIRMPLFENRLLPDRSRRMTHSGFREAGGRVLQVHEGGGRILDGRRQTGGIEGVVVDSVGTPLAGARVGVVGSNQEVFTDAEGRFGIVGLAQGTYRVRFVDPRLASLGLAPEPLTREVLPGEMSYLEFHMPAVTDLLLERCRDEPGAVGTAVLVGRVVDALGVPWANATVRVTWPSLLALDARGGSLVYVEDTEGLEIDTGPDGLYAFCGVPREARLEVSTFVEGVESPAGTVTIGTSEAGTALEVRRARESGAPPP